MSHPGGALLKFLNIRTMINKLVAVYPQSAPALLCTALQVSWQRGKFPKLFGLSIPLPLGNHVPSDGVPRSWFLLFQYRNNPSVTAACSVQTIQRTDSNIIRTSSQHWTPLDAERGKLQKRQREIHTSLFLIPFYFHFFPVETPIFLFP